MMKIEIPISLTEKIVNMLHSVTDGDVNFMNTDGKIIASVQKNN